MKKYILAIDQGTTSSRAIIFDEQANVISLAQKEFPQYFPQPGWVEHDANEIFQSVLDVVKESIQNANISIDDIAGIGITNQRETTVVWDRATGEPIYHAIVWQSRQTSDICDGLKEKGYGDLIRKKTGLPIDPYFSASKIRWILDHCDGAQEKAEKGELCAGTIDSWLIYCLSGKKEHVTEYSNACRTMLYNIHDLCWDNEILEVINIPSAILPEVKDSSSIFAYTEESLFGKTIPICGVLGDQQAALFGQQCFSKGMVKNTYGTGCFLLMNTDDELIESQNGLVSTIAWGINGKISYALEGSVFVAGSAIQWLRDELQFFENASQSEKLAKDSKDDSVIVVPSFVGLGAPYWDDKCRGAIFGLTRGSNRNDITRATLESLAYQTKDVLDAMSEDSHQKITQLSVDGGACKNNYLMKFQSDLLQCDVIRPENVETTALGVMMLAGLSIGLFENLDVFNNWNQNNDIFHPEMKEELAKKKYHRWQKAIQATRLLSFD